MNLIEMKLLWQQVELLEIAATASGIAWNCSDYKRNCLVAFDDMLFIEFKICIKPTSSHFNNIILFQIITLLDFYFNGDILS